MSQTAEYYVPKTAVRDPDAGTTASADIQALRAKMSTRLEALEARLPEDRVAIVVFSEPNMLRMGPRMMRSLMREQNVASVEDLRAMALPMGARMIGCTLAMDVMGVDAAERVDGVELGGVAIFMEEALRSRFTLFL